MKRLIILLLMLATILLLIQPFREWDEYVYLMNGKYFSGIKTYFEAIRPPFLPIILSIFNTLGVVYLIPLIPVIFLIALLILLYLLSREFLDKDLKLHPLLIILSTPLLIMYSEKIMTSLPSTVLCLSSIYLLKKYTENKKVILLYLSFFSASLTTLTRYPMGLTYIILLILYFVFAERKNWKKLITAQFFFITPLLLWFNYIGINSLHNAILWASYPSSALYYLTNSLIILGPVLLLLPLLINYKFEKKDLWFLIPLIVLLLFFQIFTNKQVRYLIPILPFLSLLLSKCVRLNQKRFTIMIIVFFIISLFFVKQYYASFCNNESGMNELRNYFKDKHGNILSNFWPICSYYTNNTCYALIEPFSELNERIESVNASYIIVSTNYNNPPYSTNQSSFSNYTMNKLINTTCENISIYKVN